MNDTLEAAPVKPAAIILPDSAFAVEPWMIEPPALDDPARRWWAEQNTDWHEGESATPFDDGILASDWEFNRHLDDLADVRAAEDAMSAGYAVL